jgi:Isochorismatase family
VKNDLGVWKAEDCALLLIDYQNEMFEVIRSETPADVVELHARLLARTARAFGMPIVASTVGVRYGFNGPTLPSVLAELDGVEPIDQALQDGYDVLYVTDAVGGRSQTAHRTAIDRLAHAGAVPTTALAVVTELFRDWAAPLAGPARDVIYWYFNEAPKHTDQVGVAAAEKLAASAQGAH